MMINETERPKVGKTEEKTTSACHPRAELNYLSSLIQ